MLVSTVLVLTFVLTTSASVAESPEQDLLCRIHTCDPDPLIDVVKRQEVGRIKFYTISPKGRMAKGIQLRGADLPPRTSPPSNLDLGPLTCPGKLYQA